MKADRPDGNQDRPAVLYPHLDPRVQRPRHPIQHIEPGPDRHPYVGRQPDKAQFTAAVPLNRLGRPEEIAAAALFLASDDSSFVAGVELSVDGGMAQV